MDGHEDIASLLIERGAKVDTQDNRGRSALMMATENSHADMVTILVSKGADPARADKKGVTAEKLASDSGDAATVQALKCP